MNDEINRAAIAWLANLSKEEQAILAAAHSVQASIILHRVYKRSGGKSQFSKNAIGAAKNALEGLDPVSAKAAGLVARDRDVAKAAVAIALEGLEKAQSEAWESIRAIRMTDDEVSNLTREAPIFKHYRDAAQLYRTSRDLRQDFIVGRVAHLAGRLVDRVLSVETDRDAA